MKLISLTCPACGSDLQVDTGRQFLYCEFCGRKIIIDDEVRRTEHTENINLTVRTVDVAREKEADAQLQKVEYAREKYRQQCIQKENRRKRRRTLVFLFFCFFVLTAVIGAVQDSTEKKIIGKFSDELIRVCRNHGSEIKDIKLSSDRTNIDITILTYTSKTGRIDELEKVVADVLNTNPGYSYTIRFRSSKYNTVRYTKINEYGYIDHYYDYTVESEMES